MNETPNTTADTGEKIIDIRSLFFFLLKLWRGLLLLVLIGGIAGFGFASFANRPAEYDPNDPDNEHNRPLLYEIERTYAQYLQKVKERSQEYRVFLDPKTEYGYATVKYYIDAQNDKATRSLGTLLDVTREDTYLDKLWEITQPTKLPGVKEDTVITRNSLGVILNHSFAANGDPESVSLYTGGELPSNVVYVVITYTIHYVTEEQREKIIDFVDREMQALKAQEETVYGSFRMERFSLFRGQEQPSYTFSRKNEVESLDYSEYQTFYKWLLAEQKLKDTSYDNNEVVQYFRESVLGEKAVSGSRIKTALIAAFVGAVLWFVWAVIRYFAGGRIRAAEEVTARFGISSLGTVRTEPKHSFFLDRLIRKWEKTGSCSEEYAAAAASLLPQKLLFCTTADGKETEARGRRFLEACGGLGAGNPARDETLLRTAKEAQEAGALLLIELGESSMRKVEEAVEACRVHCIPVVGTLFYEEA